jgi:hypothetical protein
MPPPCFPPAVRRLDAPLPSPGFRRDGFPCFNGTVRALRLLPLRPAALLVVARQYHTLPPAFRFPRPWMPDRGPGSLGFGTPEPIVRWREAGLPGSWGTLVCVRPVLRPRQDRCPLALAGHRRGPSFSDSTGSCELTKFRGSIAGHSHSLSTLRRVGRPTTTQDSLPAAGSALPGGIGYPQGSCERFPRIVLHLFLLPQALPGATEMMSPEFR